MLLLAAMALAAEGTVRVALEGPVQNGVLVVSVEGPPGAVGPVPTPVVPGLTLTPLSDVEVEAVGDWQVSRQRYRFEGEPGMVEVPALVTAGAAPSEPLWIDLNVEPPRPRPPDDLAEPWLEGTVWPWLVGLLIAAVGLVAAGARWAMRPPPALVVDLADESPDVVALRAWAALRADDRLDPNALAMALSRLFRTYLEAAQGFPAASWTTTQTLEHLATLSQLPEGNVPRARRLLRATDRVKYADARATEELFRSLDADLRDYLAATRPRGRS